MRIIYLKWMDAASYSDRKPLDLALEDSCLVVETAGFVLREDMKSITVLQSLFHYLDKHHEEADNYIVIPKGWIIERKNYEP